MKPIDVLDEDYTTLLEIDTFRVVKDEKFEVGRQKKTNNFAEHWIAHMCDAYSDSEDDATRDVDVTPDTITLIDQTGVFDVEEIREGNCYYCKLKIPDPIVALWSLLEWESAGEILHKETPRMYQVQNKPLVL